MALIKPGQLSSGSFSISGSFSGSFFGDGSNLTNLPIPQIETGSFVTTSSFNAFTGSYNTGSFSGSFEGTSSYALTASYLEGGVTIDTGSFATTGSNIFIGNQTISGSIYQSGTFYPDQIDWFSSSIGYDTGSYILTTTINGLTTYANYSDVANTLAPYIPTVSSSISASYATNALSASFAPSTPAFPFTGSALITGSLGVTGSFSVNDNTSNILIVSSSGLSTFTNPTQLSGNITASPLITLNQSLLSFGNSSVMLRLVETSINNSFSVALYKRSGTNETHLLTGGAGSGTNTERTFIAVTGNNTDGAGSLYINKANTNIGYGVTGGDGARLDIKAQGALSSDLAFRVRNSADSFNLLSIDGVGLISGRTDGAGGFNMNYQGTSNTTVQLTFNNGNPTLRVANNNGGHAFNVYTSTDNREYLAGLIGKATLAIGANPLGGTIKANEANTNTIYVFSGTAPALNTANSFQLYSSTGSITSNSRPHFRTENGTVVWLGDESRLFHVTASRTIISSSQNTISGSSLTVFGSGSAQPVFTVQGSQGELFSVTDSLSGSLFSVNDISGLPILEVFSDSTTLIGDYLDPMLITTKRITMTNSGSFVVYSLPTSSYDTAFYDYSIRSGSNARAGQIMAIQSGSSVNFTETTTTDFGDTTAVSFTVIVSGSNMVLTGSATTGSWTTKCIIRGL